MADLAADRWFKSRNELLEIVRSGDFSTLIGRKEDQVFEAKGAKPYDLDSLAGRVELAKDASAFANAYGGVIVVGLRHDQLASEPTDEVKALDLLPQGQFQVSKILGILKNHIHPHIEAIDASWHASKDHPGLGLGVVDVPPQREERKLFLITKTVDEFGVALKEIVFGVAQRVNASNDPYTAAQLSEWIKKGRGSIVEHLGRLERKVDTLLKPAAPPTADEFKQRVENLVKRAVR